MFADTWNKSGEAAVQRDSVERCLHTQRGCIRIYANNAWQLARFGDLYTRWRTQASLRGSGEHVRIYVLYADEANPWKLRHTFQATRVYHRDVLFCVVYNVWYMYSSRWR